MNKLTKCGDRTIVHDNFGFVFELSNRAPNEEAGFAMQIIANDQSDRPCSAVVERAFRIAQLTFKHIKDAKMDAPFPFKKVYPDAKANNSGS